MTKRHSGMDPTATDYIFHEIRFPEIEMSMFKLSNVPGVCIEIDCTPKPLKTAKIDKKKHDHIDRCIFD